jgi:hypothetical protein
MSQRRTLVLAIAPDNAAPDTHLMAGPWCFHGREDAFPDWDDRFAFPPDPYATGDEVATAIDEANSYAIARIPDLALRLGAHHGANLPRDFWDLTLYPWLTLCCQMLHERQRRVQDMIRLWGNEELDVPLLPRDCEFSFEDSHQFILAGAQNQLFNWWVFSRILEPQLPAAWRAIHADPVVRHSGAPAEGGLRALARRLLYALPFPRIKGFSTLQSLVFSMALMGPRTCEDRTIPLAQLKGRMPAWRFEPDDVILPSIPRALCQQRLPRTVKPGRPRTRVVNVASYHDDAYRMRVALDRAAGARLVFIQHGGNYGHIRESAVVPYYEYRQHAFVTWGWTSHAPFRGNYVPLPHAQLDRIKDSHADRTGALVLVGAEMSLLSYRLDSRPQSLQWLDYRRDKARLLAALPDHVRASALYRPYFQTMSGLDDGPWVLRRFADVRRCEGSLDEHMLGCRLLVLDHHGTTLELAMAANTPTVLFWNPEHWRVGRETAAALAELAAVGIHHATPNAAAAHICRIWPDVQGWWQSEAVQQARRNWCTQYAMTTPGSINGIWLDALRGL